MAEQLPDVATSRPVAAAEYTRLCQEPERCCPTCKMVKPAVAFFVFQPECNWGYESRQCQPCYQRTRELNYPTCCLCAQKKPPTDFMSVQKYSVGVDGRGASPCCKACTDAFLALPNQEQRRHIRLRLDSLYPARAVIYALVDPRTEEVCYIGRTSNLQQRYQEHLRTRSPKRVINPYRMGTAWYSRNNWIHDLADEGFQPIPTILHTVETGPLVVEWEGRWIAFGIQQGWPLLNAETIVDMWTVQIQASYLDMLHAPFQTLMDSLVGGPYADWLHPCRFAAFVRAWYVDECDILPEANEPSMPVLMQTGAKGEGCTTRAALVTRSAASPQSPA